MERPSLKSSYNPVKVEEWVLKFWDENKIYEKAKKKSWEEGKGPVFAFLEGPPTTNGFMHVGHARGRTLKDVKLRYMRMRGYRVWDQAGWDTQGLPVELEVEKKLGLKSKRDIEKLGVERFVEECRKLVDYYMEHWVRASKRLGLWLDYEHAYETRHPRYIEQVWSFIKKAHEKGLLYEGRRVVPRCPRCGTALSSHEVAQGYELVEDPSVYFKLPLLDEPNTYLVAWTTTPWTIIANEMAAVHPDETYVVVEVGGEKWILAEKRLEAFAKEVGLKDYRVMGRLRGRELEGRRYRHPLAEEVPYHQGHDHEPYHTVYTADWVTMEEGTGVVHAAPAHGPEDFEMAQKHGVDVYTPLREDGYFGEDAGAFKGLWFEEASKHVVEVLKRKGLLVYAGKYPHEYPFCWRCGTRLFYYASRQWFIRITDELRRKMAAEVYSMRWAPSWAAKRMGDWVENARDWCISRERYWGTPLPVWRCTSCNHIVVVGSLEELKQLATDPNSVPSDPHRPYIDRVELRCPKCGGVMKREPFVVDVWMDSGVAHTASLAQYGWLKLWDTLYPYQWITEAADQTRGWFYTLLVTGVVWHERKPYREVLLQGHVLDKYGKKMSKSKGNVIWALEWMEKNGTDPMRIFLLSRAPWDSINFDPDEVRRYQGYLNILWNTVKFADTYMELDKWKPKNPAEARLAVEDRWILYRLWQALEKASEAIESDNMHQAVQALVDLVVEQVSHRYIPLIRPRVWEEEMTESKDAAYATLYYVLRAVLAAMAPIAPFVTEYLYQAFVRKYEPDAPESIHLNQWPTVPQELLDEKAYKAVEEAFAAAEKILAERSEKRLKRRWPLRRAVILVKNEDLRDALREAASVLARFANIKTVELAEAEPDWAQSALKIDTESMLVYVDMELDEETLLEGLAREVIRRAQVLRKELDLPVDHVVEELMVYATGKVLEAVKRFEDLIRSEVRAKKITLLGTPPDKAKKWSIEDMGELHLALTP
ncbi:isoleucine--tRNA ligase [Hyperthermus butylicus]|uniref:Isoleucine--tRNA ligase n=1 Tax=Hyperthermus butylicus (strain DSM 5456 / JCM 9403 / PLM1-5) TaxID=415426 RepID=A2BMN8_HYPBU|nr:isoleucine--tRNA ligase [Hyperthermus butylicus]ABM81249.1 Isoleucyl-tRNA synthetase [Hyperthermus butylicus DSM 5456]